jgi:hypothetical protein
MKKSILLLLFVVLFIPFNVKAVYDVTNPDCTNDEKMKLRNEASNIKFVTEKYKENDNVYYSLQILDLQNTINIQDDSTKTIYKISGDKILKITPGVTKNLLIYANENSVCNGYSIFTKSVVIPFYNKYSIDPLCKGNEEHILCKENTSIQVSEDEFKRILNAYIKEKNEKPSDDEEEIPVVEKPSVYDQIMSFLISYYIYILLGIIVLGTSGIVILEVQKRRSIL